MRRAVSISGGSDSVFLLHRMLCEKAGSASRPVLLHMNHRLRGAASDEDQRFVESLGKTLDLPVVVGFADIPDVRALTGIEARARSERYAFIRKTCAEKGIRRVFVAHTADDQVETILMRFFEGAGISGLKGIPRSGEGGIERPLLNVWRTEILETLGSSGHPYRIDESNADTRFERNWIRHLLLPMLTDRYGETVKKRIHALGERFRELDTFVTGAATRWIRRNVKGAPPSMNRKSFARLPAMVRIAVLQHLVHELGGKSANERLLVRLDRSLVSGKPSASVSIGKRVVFRNRYDMASILPPDDSDFSSRPLLEPDSIRIPDGSPSRYRFSGNGGISVEVNTRPISEVLEQLTRQTGNGDRNVAFFDSSKVAFPLVLSPLIAGDAVNPFGGAGSRKVKEIMIDLKTPRETRWGRATLRDAAGRILWIPGIVRSDLAPVRKGTRQLLCLTSRSLC